MEKTICFIQKYFISGKIYNTALHHRWNDFKYDVTTLNLPIDPKFLYNLNMNDNILGFCYGLLQSRIDINKMIVIIRIIPHPDHEPHTLWSSSYKHLEPLTKSALDIPLNIFICKRLHIKVNQSQMVCIDCKKNKYYISREPKHNICLNKVCLSFSLINFDTIPVYNNDGQILCTYEHVEINSELRNNLNIIAARNCYKCSSCKSCTKKRIEFDSEEKCKRHKFCTHSKPFFRKKDLMHSLNLLSHNRAKEAYLKRKKQ